MYCVQATVTYREASGLRTVQIPTFFLDASVQGIRSEEHAWEIACMIIRVFDGGELSLTVAKV